MRKLMIHVFRDGDGVFANLDGRKSARKCDGICTFECNIEDELVGALDIMAAMEDEELEGCGTLLTDAAVLAWKDCITFADSHVIQVVLALWQPPQGPSLFAGRAGAMAAALAFDDADNPPLAVYWDDRASKIEQPLLKGQICLGRLAKVMMGTDLTGKPFRKILETVIEAGYKKKKELTT